MTSPPVADHTRLAGEILARLDEKPTMARTAAAMHELRELSDAHPGGFTGTRVAVVRNFTIEPIEPYVAVAGFRSGLDVRLSYSSYSPSAPEVAGLSADCGVVWVAMRLEDLSPALTREFADTEPVAAIALADGAVDHVLALAGAARDASSAQIVVDNFVMPLSPRGGLADFQRIAGQAALNRRMNVALVDGVADLSSVAILDVDQLFAQIGLRACFDLRGERSSAAPLTPVALEALGQAFIRHHLGSAGARIKCLVVDCDNTLWGGVIGEDGIGGITLSATGAGRRYQDFQRQLLDLRRRGIVLAICSKNEEADVFEVMKKHPDFLLQETDFASMRINWEPKASNLVAIAEELNLSLHHLAFVDDDAVECESIAARLPDVTVIHFPLRGAELLDDLGLFDVVDVTGEDATRTEMYRAEAQRKTARATASSHEDFMRSLDIVATIGAVTEARLARLAQLTQRTNQFNLTTRRYDAAEIAALAAEPSSAVRWVELQDRFGSYGVVGLVIVRSADATATIDTLLLSCRVLGRGVETVLVRQAAAIAREMGAHTLDGEYIPSQRNQQVEGLYGRLGFTGPAKDGEAQRWTMRLADGDIEVPDWITIVEAEDDA